MAKIFPGPLAPPSVPRVRGQIITNVRQDGTLQVQKWPRKRGKAREGYDLYRQLEFRLVASWASNPEPIALQTAMELADGSDNVPRDLIMMASYGTLYEIRRENGQLAEVYRVVAPNAQLILDQVTDVPGSILYRAQIGWIGLPPGNNSFVLTMSGNVPMWLPVTGGGGGGADVQLFDTPGAAIYTIPANKSTISVTLIGGGGGGGTGRRTMTGTAASGGGGGGGGAVLTTSLSVAVLPATLDLVVAAGGAGAPPRTTDNTNGSGGSAGGNTTLTNGVWTLTAAGGSAGSAGSTAAAGNSNGGQIGRFLGGGGGGCGAGSQGSNAITSSAYGATGGGGGAGVPAVPANRNGGNGGFWAPATGYPNLAAAGGNAATATPPQDGVAFSLDNVVGGGAGGGYATAAGLATAGGDGGNYGGGGGGGAASLNGNDTGRGGNGASGAVLIIAW